jgi:SdpC family antimicrobial peptide
MSHLRSITASILSLALVSQSLVGCAPEETPSKATEHVVAAGETLSTTYYDGITLFKGLLFRTGPVAAKIPELWTLLGQQNVPTRKESINQATKAAHTFTSLGKTEAATAMSKIAAKNAQIPASSPTEAMPDALVDNIVASIDAADPTFFDRFATEMQSGDVVRADAILLEAGSLAADALANFVNGTSADSLSGVWWYWDVAVAIEVAAVLIVALVAVIPLIKSPDGTLLHDEVVMMITDSFYYAP